MQLAVSIVLEVLASIVRLKTKSLITDKGKHVSGQVITISYAEKSKELTDVPCLVAQSCPTLCDPMCCGPPGSSVRGDSPGKNIGVGIFPTQGLNPGLLHCRRILHHLNQQGSPRILEWVAYHSPADIADPRIKLGSPAL